MSWGHWLEHSRPQLEASRQPSARFMPPRTTQNARALWARAAVASKAGRPRLPLHPPHPLTLGAGAAVACKVVDHALPLPIIDGGSGVQQHEIVCVA